MCIRDRITWVLAIPSSSSHALIGGLIGAAWAEAGVNAVQWGNFGFKVLVPLFSSPVLGFAIGLTVMVILLNAIGWANPHHLVRRLNRPNATGAPAASSVDGAPVAFGRF